VIRTADIFQGMFEVTPTGPFNYDLVDISRQVLSNIFYDLTQIHDAAYAQYNQTVVAPRNGPDVFRTKIIPNVWLESNAI